MAIGDSVSLFLSGFNIGSPTVPAGSAAYILDINPTAGSIWKITGAIFTMDPNDIGSILVNMYESGSNKQCQTGWLTTNTGGNPMTLNLGCFARSPAGSASNAGAYQMQHGIWLSGSHFMKVLFAANSSASSWSYYVSAVRIR